MLRRYLYAVRIYASGGDKWTAAMTLIEALALAQISWLGGILAFIGSLIKEYALKRVGLWISVVSVISHGLFLMLVYVFGYGTS